MFYNWFFIAIHEKNVKWSTYFYVCIKQISVEKNIWPIEHHGLLKSLLKNI